MSEANDLKEFNERVFGGSSSRSDAAVPRGRPRFRKGQETLELVGEDGTEKTGTTIGLRADSQMWAVYGNQHYSACEKAVDVLPPGQYVVDVSNELGIHFRSTEVTLDDLVELPDSVSEEVISEIETFWKRESRFRDYGFLWKRGVLMWGPPGGGKTSTLQVISQRIIDHGGISIYVNSPDLTARGLAILRRVEPKRPLVVMIEDIDAVIDNHGEAELLALMDGELQIDNVVFIATTNYPEKLDKRFINRPSRFDVVKKIGMPSEAARKVYLEFKNERLRSNAEELEIWVAATEGFSVAHIKELIISVEVFEVPMVDAVERLKTMMAATPSSSESTGNFGFTR
jgi:AAA+ superfamily predicted ATPase